MKRTILLWLILRELQRRGNTTYNKAESKLIRQGKRQYMDRVLFAEDMSKSMADWSFYQKLIPKYHLVLEKPARPSKDKYYLLVESLIDTALNRQQPLIERMSEKTGKPEDENHIRVSCHGDDFCGISDLIMELATKYSTIWIPVASAMSFGLGLIAS